MDARGDRRLRLRGDILLFGQPDEETLLDPTVLRLDRFGFGGIVGRFEGSVLKEVLGETTDEMVGEVGGRRRGTDDDVGRTEWGGGGLRGRGEIVNPNVKVTGPLPIMLIGVRLEEVRLGG